MITKKALQIGRSTYLF